MFKSSVYSVRSNGTSTMASEVVNVPKGLERYLSFVQA